MISINSNLLEAQSLAIIDQEIGNCLLSAAEYEIIRQVIFQTADFEYLSLISFSPRSLHIGAAALAARITVVVDDPMILVGITQEIEKTFINQIYCAKQIIAKSEKEENQTVLGMQILARRYPESIFVIGQDQVAFAALLDLIEAKIIRPALIINAFSGFFEVESLKQRLNKTLVPNITVDGRKGGPTVAVAIFKALVRLAWYLYEQEHI